jgi:Uma2 family endonuclease
MTLASHESKPFEPGTTGWTASDLDDPAIERLWFAGRYEIVEGVLTTMPPAYFVGGHALANLLFVLTEYSREKRLGFHFATEVDVVIDESRLARIDAVMLTSEDRARQAAAVKRAGRKDPDRTRILVPPTLAIEVVSPGHELHDRRTKRRWYADFGVPNYWILDPFDRSLQGLTLEGGAYANAFSGREDAELSSPMFPGLCLALGPLWHD